MSPPPDLLAFSHTSLLTDSAWSHFRQYVHFSDVHPEMNAERLWVTVRQGDVRCKLTLKGDRWEAEVFDLARDPLETTNVYDIENRKHAEMVALLEAYRAELVSGFQPTEPVPREIQRLRSLGYIGGEIQESSSE